MIEVKNKRERERERERWVMRTYSEFARTYACFSPIQSTTFASKALLSVVTSAAMASNFLSLLICLFSLMAGKRNDMEMSATPVKVSLFGE